MIDSRGVIISIARFIVFCIFVLGCVLISFGCNLLSEFSAQNFEIEDEAYGFFVVFIVAGFIFFWGFVLALPSGVYLIFFLWALGKRKLSQENK